MALLELGVKNTERLTAAVHHLIKVSNILAIRERRECARDMYKVGLIDDVNYKKLLKQLAQSMDNYL